MTTRDLLDKLLKDFLRNRELKFIEAENPRAKDTPAEFELERIIITEKSIDFILKVDRHKVLTKQTAYEE